MPANKLSRVYKFRHFGLFVPDEGAERFPTSLLMKGYPCIPFSETDAARINGGYVEPIVVLAFSENELAPAKKWSDQGWTYYPWKDQYADLPTDEFERQSALWSAEANTPKGKRFGQSLKYQHTALATPVRFPDFPLNCIRYDRVHFFAAKDAELAEMTIKREGELPHPIRLVQYSETAKPRFTDGMWDAHGWKIESVPYWDAVRVGEK